MESISPAKLKLYRTAYSPLYGKYVAILGVRLFKGFEPMLDCEMGDKEIAFRASELEGYCL